MSRKYSFFPERANEELPPKPRVPQGLQQMPLRPGRHRLLLHQERLLPAQQ